MNPFLKTLSGRILNFALWLNACALAGTGLLLAFRLPPGSRGGRGLAVLGLDRHQWGDMHTWLGYAFLVLLLLHLAVHWRWLWQYASRRRKAPLFLGLGAGLLLLIVLLFLPVERRAGKGQGGQHGARHGAPPSTESQGR